MNAATLDAMTLLQRLIVERVLVLAKELEGAARYTPHRQIIDRCESPCSPSAATSSAGPWWTPSRTGSRRSKKS
jgi:hypothetical protein